MTLILAPRARARTRLAAVLGAAAVAVATLLAPVPATAATPATPATAPSVTLAPSANGILSAGVPFSATVLVTEDDGVPAPAGTATLTVGAAPLTARADVSAWLGGQSASVAGTPLGADLGAASTPAAPTGETVSVAITAAVDDPALAGRAPGVYPLEASVGIGANTVSARSVMIVPAVPAATSALGVVVPVTAAPLSTGLLTADQLTALTATDGDLTAVLDAVDGTDAILAIDPAVPAAIRALGTGAPATAAAWLTRLTALPNSRFALQFGDADVSAQLDAGLAAPLAPTSLQAYLSPGNFVSAPAAGATPAPTPRAGANTPSLEALLDVSGSGPTRAAVYWPPTGSATAAEVTTLGGLGSTALPALTLIPSGTTTAREATTVPVHGDADGASVLVYDSELSRALTAAAADPSGVSRGASLAAATAYATLATSGGPVLAVIDRVVPTAEHRLSRASLRAAITVGAGVPGTAGATLGALTAVAPTAVTVDGGTTDAERADAVSALLNGSERIARFATVLEDPALLNGPERAAILQILGVGWIGTGDGWTTALAAHRDSVTTTLGSVSIVPPSPVNLLSADTGLRVWLRNDLPSPVTVVLHAEPDDLRLDVQRSTTVRIEAASNIPVEIPVKARVGSGQVSVSLTLTSPTGEAIGGTTSVDATLRAEWEGIGIVVLASIVGILLVLGVIRTVLRRRARRAAAADGAE
jgi:hypothetical protein